MKKIAVLLLLCSVVISSNCFARVEFTDKEIKHFKAEFSRKELRELRDQIIAERDALLAEEDAKNQISKQEIIDAYEVLIDAKEAEIGNVGIGITVPIQ